MFARRVLGMALVFLMIAQLCQGQMQPGVWTISDPIVNPVRVYYGNVGASGVALYSHMTIPCQPHDFQTIPKGCLLGIVFPILSSRLPSQAIEANANTPSDSQLVQQSVARVVAAASTRLLPVSRVRCHRLESRSACLPHLEV